MNLLLLRERDLTQIGAEHTATVRGERAAHLRNVLRVEVGSTLRAAIVDGAYGVATVVELSSDSVNVRFSARSDGGSQPYSPSLLRNVDVVLAMPRPKVLTRVMASLASFGVRSVGLTNSWRVEKSYLGSARTQADAIEQALFDGAEQGGHNRLPAVTIYSRFMEMVESELAKEVQGWAATSVARTVCVAHPGSSATFATIDATSPMLVAIGPEGGWIDKELATFVQHGAHLIWLSGSVLRVETAIAAALGQLELCKRSAT